jgi:hypothetical protein
MSASSATLILDRGDGSRNLCRRTRTCPERTCAYHEWQFWQAPQRLSPPQTTAADPSRWQATLLHVFVAGSYEAPARCRDIVVPSRVASSGSSDGHAVTQYGRVGV